MGITKIIINILDIMRFTPAYERNKHTPINPKVINNKGFHKNLDIFGAGFNINVFNENLFQYTFTNDIDVSTLRTICKTDRLINLPITDLYLYFNFKGFIMSGTTYTNTIKILDINNVPVDDILTSKLSDNYIINNGILLNEIAFDISNFNITQVIASSGESDNITLAKIELERVKKWQSPIFDKNSDTPTNKISPNYWIKIKFKNGDEGYLSVYK